MAAPLAVTWNEKFVKVGEEYLTKKRRCLEEAEKAGGRALEPYLKYGTTRVARMNSYLSERRADFAKRQILGRYGIDIDVLPDGRMTTTTTTTIADNAIPLLDRVVADRERGMRAASIRTLLGVDTDVDREVLDNDCKVEALMNARVRLDCLVSPVCAGESCDDRASMLCICQSCFLASYCSETCRLKDKKAVHRLECKVLCQIGQHEELRFVLDTASAPDSTSSAHHTLVHSFQCVMQFLREEIQKASAGDCNNSACGASPSSWTKFCSACRLARYCSVDCQRTDWKHHKAQCKFAQGGATH